MNIGYHSRLVCLPVISQALQDILLGILCSRPIQAKIFARFYSHITESVTPGIPYALQNILLMRFRDYFRHD